MSSTRPDPLPRCPACDHVLASAGDRFGIDARCPECGLAGAAAQAVSRRGQRLIFATILIAVIARCGHAVGLLGPEVGWTSQRAEATLLMLRTGAAALAALAFALVTVWPHWRGLRRWLAIAAAGLMIAVGAVVLTIGIGGLAVTTLPTWLLDLLADPSGGRIVGAVPPAGQVLAVVGLSGAIWLTRPGVSRATIVGVLGYAVLFGCVEVLLRLQLLESAVGRRLAVLVLAWRLWYRVSVDAVAIAGWLLALRWPRSGDS